MAACVFLAPETGGAITGGVLCDPNPLAVSAISIPATSVTPKVCAGKAADGSRIDSVREIIQRWAPPSENNTNAYALNVARALGLDPDFAGVDVYDFEVMRILVPAVIRHENGFGPLPGGQWYGHPIIAEGLLLAGIESGVVHGKGEASA
jgi:hypothetical protein